MEYTIQQLAELAGVSARTLRWYHKLGLLTPERVAENGYRFYGPQQVDRLQQILFYRALGVELRQIKEILDDPNFDRLSALKGHLQALQAQERNIQTMIQTVRDTIRAEERDEIMSDEAKFQAFKRRVVEENEASYGKEARQAYGDAAVDEANASVMGLTREQYAAWTGLGEEIQAKLEEAVEQGLDPQSEEGREITRLHRQWLSFTDKRYDPAKHRGIAQLYVLDERFQAYYDKRISGCAQFLTAAICFWTA